MVLDLRAHLIQGTVTFLAAFEQIYSVHQDHPFRRGCLPPTNLLVVTFLIQIHVQILWFIFHSPPSGIQQVV